MKTMVFFFLSICILLVSCKKDRVCNCIAETEQGGTRTFSSPVNSNYGKAQEVCMDMCFEKHPGTLITAYVE